MGDEAPAVAEVAPAEVEAVPAEDTNPPAEPAEAAPAEAAPAEEAPTEEGEAKPPEAQEDAAEAPAEEQPQPEGEAAGEAAGEGAEATEEAAAEGEEPKAEDDVGVQEHVEEISEAPKDVEGDAAEKPKEGEEEAAEGVELAAEPEDDDDDFLDEGDDFRRASDISAGKFADDKDAKKKSMDKKKNKAMGSIISIRRGNMEYFDRQKVPRYMNSYKLESDKPFNVEVVENILKEVLTEALQDLDYDEDKVPKQAKWASSAIRAKVKEQEYDRYKIVCMVTIGEKRSQDVFYLFRMLWDSERDKYAKFTHENMYVFAVALCFGLYYE